MTEDRVYMTILFDHYGALLTERQQKLMALRYNDDLSLSEIAEVSGGTRQSVWDTLRRAEAVLQDMEARLGLVRRLAAHRAAAARMEQLLGELTGLTEGRARALCQELAQCAAEFKE
ncbi:MAG: DNA-binding protein [Clostridiales bacterium]|nr:DNA-binding protein [Clostridiales bacterium]